MEFATESTIVMFAAAAAVRALAVLLRAVGEFLNAATAAVGKRKKITPTLVSA
jgi:hypothetical protein